jgi:beta-lactamase class D
VPQIGRKRYVPHEANEKVYLYSGLKEIHENKLTAKVNKIKYGNKQIG